MLQCLLACIGLISLANASLLPPSTLHQPHSDPNAVAQEVRWQVQLSRQHALQVEDKEQQQCRTGNPIDDCWRCAGTDWRTDRQRLADCGIGFGRDAMGGKGGPIYVVTDSSDNAAPGTLRYGVIQEGPLWITFSADMTIRLNGKLVVKSFKTIDGRGANVHITGGGCIDIKEVSNIIIHNVHIHHCVPAGSDGDGITIHTGHKIWIDHCDLSYCTDGLIDATRGSTGITISNCYFSHHDKVMLLGHNDNYLADAGMQVTVAFNRFGEALEQRMPRCRHGYFHVVNNDYAGWGVYAVGGSASPTINSQGNRYVAPPDAKSKEVTKRMDTDKSEWAGWNWRSEGDLMVNGAFFVASGTGVEVGYTKASSMEPIAVSHIVQLTRNAGVLGEPSAIGGGTTPPGGNCSVTNGSSGAINDNEAGYGNFSMSSGRGTPPPSSLLSISLLWTFLSAFFSHHFL